MLGLLGARWVALGSLIGLEDEVLRLVFDLFHSLDISIDLADVLPHQRIAFAHLQPDMLEYDTELGIDRRVYLGLRIRLRK